MKKFVNFSRTSFLCAALLSLSVVTTTSAKEPYKIGAVFAITGGASFLGEPERNTVKMIAEEINKQGGINGHPLEIIIYDTEGNETKAVTSTKKLIEKDNVLAVIGASTSGPSMAIIPILNSHEVPNISCAASGQIAHPVNERKWIFKIPPDDDLGVELTYDYMKSKGIKKLGILTSSNGYGISGRTELKKLAPLHGIEIVADETYGPKEADLTAQLTKIRAQNPQAILNYSVGPTQVICTRNWKQLGISVPLYQSYGFGSKKNVELAGGTAEGVIAPVSRLVIADKLKTSSPYYSVVIGFRDSYMKMYNEPPSQFAGLARDAMYQLIDALKMVGSNKPEIRTYLENIKNFVGCNGTYNRSANDHVGLTKECYVMAVVKEGEFIPIE